MPLKQYNPTSPGRRFMTTLDFTDLSKKRPERALTEPLRRSGGRNNKGRITIWFRGGGHKRAYRIVDSRRDKRNVPAKVAALEYDPNRSARIALLHYADGDKRYILAPEGLKLGQTVVAGEGADILPGNALPLKMIPAGTMIHNLELRTGKGAQLVRSAGAAAQLVAKEGEYAQVKLPSGEVRKLHVDCMATVGQVGNVENSLIKLGKAGRVRHRRRRPQVRGVVMNPVDHPHGGGEGKAPIGMPGPKSPWGKPTLGKRTRDRKPSDKFIVRRRKS